jgi:hypothetical protein
MASRGSSASLVDAALGLPAASGGGSNDRGGAAAAAAATTAAPPPPGPRVAGPIWGSFERNTGTWTPYSQSESASIETAWQNPNVPDIEVPTCFNAVVHFSRDGGQHHQMTPAVGTKPPGFRSVLRGEHGQVATLYWWEESRLWRLERPPDGAQATFHFQEVTIEPPVQGPDEFTWQWCDLVGRAAGDAREINWHPYAAEHGADIEAAWQAKRTLELSIGLTTYQIGGWQGTYGTQKNLTTNLERQVRRGRFTVLSAVPSDYIEESCALCTESFADTPEWPIRRTPCNHAFHWTCLQHLLRQRSGPLRCPMCRGSLAGMSAGGTDGGATDSLPHAHGGGSEDAAFHMADRFGWR